MQSSLKKSLYLGLAALSFASVAAVSTNASAKSYAKAGAETDLTVTKDDTNVESTGTNALFTKPGTTKGAKVVASKAKMKKLANSGKSADYFWAYRTVTTNKGAVYYKVVTMNGKYRGYVYAGKKEGEFSRGIVKAETTTPKTTDAMLNKTVYFKNPGTHNVTWTAPKYTEHKASQRVINTTPFAGDKLTVTKAETKTRENTLYYYVEDATHPTVSGWIYAGAVSTTASDAVQAENGITVKYIDKNTAKEVSSKVLDLKGAASMTAADLATAVSDKNNIPAGYGNATVNGDTDPVVKGSSVLVYVTANEAKAMTFTPIVDNQSAGADAQGLLTEFWAGTGADTDPVTIVAKDKAFTQPEGLTMSGTDIVAQLTTDKLNTFTVKTKDAAVNGKQPAYQFTIKSADQGAFGSASNVYYTAVKGSVTENPASTGDFTPAN